MSSSPLTDQLGTGEGDGLDGKLATDGQDFVRPANEFEHLSFGEGLSMFVGHTRDVHNNNTVMPLPSAMYLDTILLFPFSSFYLHCDFACCIISSMQSM